jgi:AcrR family transcriptional regulator
MTNAPPRDPPDNRAKLLYAAASLFAEQGYAATSTRAIAAHAGCNLALISHYFGSKEGLLKALVARSFEKLGVKLDELLLSPAPADQRFSELVDFLVDHFESNHANMRIVHHELTLCSGPVIEEVRPRVVANVQKTTALLEQVQAQGRLAPSDPRIAAMLLAGSVQFYFTSHASALATLGPRTPELLALIKQNIKALFLRTPGDAHVSAK